MRGVRGLMSIKRLLSTCLSLEGRTGNGSQYTRNLVLQWHITERCNVRCAHCYQTAYTGEELPLHRQIEVLSQFEELLGTFKGPPGQTPVRGHITVTGGEPFIRKDFLDLLETFSSKKERFSFAVLTNGSFIDDSMARRLGKLYPAFVQVSIEGTGPTHDAIRGQGSYERTVTAIRHLVRQHIRTFISFTAHRSNFREFTDVVQLGWQLGVSRVWSDRLIPQGSGSAIGDEALTPEETREFFEAMESLRNRARARRFIGTDVAMHRALQFLVAGGKPYHCTAGDTLITIQPNGDLYPCRRMPIKAGNVMEKPLAKLYYESDLFRELCNRDRVSDGCEGCFYARLCRGGLKCLSYAVSGDPFKRDPGCWYGPAGYAAEQQEGCGHYGRPH
jgi:radical SAM protein with 4Fe4S-binding SPASM domain